MSIDYISNCCNVRAKKPALTKPPKDAVQDRGLGKWHCPKCGKKCTVKPVDNSVTK